ncbi:MAG: nucleotidyltransferase family protein [Alphaproteobacteria bacterium]|nr:nucleotidyltransferase family protein [Alphaproteobacteria bacterium]
MNAQPRKQAIDLALALLRYRHQPSQAVAERANHHTHLSGLDWQHLIAFTSSHFVLPAIARPLARLYPGSRKRPEAVNFVLDMRDQNACRNRQLKASLLDISAQLNTVAITPVALKGAAFLLDDPESVAPWRFMGDIDLLVHEHELEQSVAAVEKLGFTRSQEDYDPETQAHFPPLISPCETYSIELHTRLFGLDDYDISVGGLRAQSTPAPSSPAAINLPSRQHRIAHALAHAQLHNRNFVSRRLVLKDLVDLSQLTAGDCQQACLLAAMSLFRKASTAVAVNALVATWSSLTHADPPHPVTAAEQKWQQSSQARLYWSKSRALFNLPLDLARLELFRTQTERGHVRRRAAQATSPSAFRSAAQNFSHKQTTRFWNG